MAGPSACTDASCVPGGRALSIPWARSSGVGPASSVFSRDSGVMVFDAVSAPTLGRSTQAGWPFWKKQTGPIAVHGPSAAAVVLAVPALKASTAIKVASASAKAHAIRIGGRFTRKDDTSLVGLVIGSHAPRSPLNLVITLHYSQKVHR